MPVLLIKPSAKPVWFPLHCPIVLQPELKARHFVMRLMAPSDSRQLTVMVALTRHV